MSKLHFQVLRDYVKYAKDKFNPVLSDEAGQKMISYYVEMRKVGAGKGQVTAYPRQLESLIRLSEAHARYSAFRYTIYWSMKL